MWNKAGTTEELASVTVLFFITHAYLHLLCFSSEGPRWACLSPAAPLRLGLREWRCHGCGSGTPPYRPSGWALWLYLLRGAGHRRPRQCSGRGCSPGLAVIIVVQAPLEAAATAALLPGSPIVVAVVQAPLQAPARSRLRPVVGTAPSQGSPPSCGCALHGCWAGSAVALALLPSNSSITSKAPGHSWTGGLSQAAGSAGPSGASDHLSPNKQWRHKTIPSKQREYSG